MKSRRLTSLVLTSALLASLGGVTVGVSPADAAAKPAWTKNCTALNKKYPHGVGKVNAKDKTSSKKKVTNFKKSNSLYAQAMKYNKGLDRDKDGIACEKR